MNVQANTNQNTIDIRRLIGTNSSPYKQVECANPKLTYSSISMMNVYTYKSQEELFYEDLTGVFSSIKARDAAVKLANDNKVSPTNQTGFEVLPNNVSFTNINANQSGNRINNTEKSSRISNNKETFDGGFWIPPICCRSVSDDLSKNNIFSQKSVVKADTHSRPICSHGSPFDYFDAIDPSRPALSALVCSPNYTKEINTKKEILRAMTLTMQSACLKGDSNGSISKILNMDLSQFYVYDMHLNCHFLDVNASNGLTKKCIKDCNKCNKICEDDLEEENDGGILIGQNLSNRNYSFDCEDLYKTKMKRDPFGFNVLFDQNAVLRDVKYPNRNVNVKVVELDDPSRVSYLKLSKSRNKVIDTKRLFSCNEKTLLPESKRKNKLTENRKEIKENLFESEINGYFDMAEEEENGYFDLSDDQKSLSDSDNGKEGEERKDSLFGNSRKSLLLSREKVKSSFGGSFDNDSLF